MSRSKADLTRALMLTLLLAGAAAPAQAAITAVPVISGVPSVTDIVNVHDGSGRLFVVRQAGQILLWKNGALSAIPFLNISGLVVFAGEQGLLGLAFHPDYRNNGYFYVNYTRQADGATVVARYTRNAANPDAADPASARILLTIAQPYVNHNGGALRFGPDGYLYIGMGDGGSGNDPNDNAQNLGSLLGKMLRIDVNGTTGDLPYGIPAGNPFVATYFARPEIWAYGLRNPWRFNFDRGSGALFIADVGQSAWEEVDYVPPGAPGGMNFGWRVMEGNHCTGLGGDGPPCHDPRLTLPIAEYGHDLGCSVTGGYPYRGQELSSIVPDRFAVSYVYGDYCSGTIWHVRKTGDTWTSSVLLQTGFNITTFGEDELGELYVADAAAGKIYKLTEQAPTVVEFFNTGLKHYFLTAFADEAAAVDAGAAGPGWTRTGVPFHALEWGLPVCRFHGTPGRGPNSHFYTVDPLECAAVKGDPGWTFESIAFYAMQPSGGNCAAPLIPLWRTYNGRAAQNDSNHAYTVVASVYGDLVRQGWTGEGVVMCVAP